MSRDRRDDDGVLCRDSLVFWRRECPCPPHPDRSTPFRKTACDSSHTAALAVLTAPRCSALIRCASVGMSVGRDERSHSAPGHEPTRARQASGIAQPISASHRCRREVMALPLHAQQPCALARARLLRPREPRRGQGQGDRLPQDAARRHRSDRARARAEDASAAGHCVDGDVPRGGRTIHRRARLELAQSEARSTMAGDAGDLLLPGGRRAARPGGRRRASHEDPRADLA